eukprot:232556-Hanusia_phi.AAC.3
MLTIHPPFPPSSVPLRVWGQALLSCRELEGRGSDRLSEGPEGTWRFASLAIENLRQERDVTGRKRAKGR